MLPCFETSVPFLQSSFEELPGHPHSKSAFLQSIHWNGDAAPNHSWSPACLPLKNNAQLQSSYRHSQLPMKKHSLWQILSCLAVVQPALSVPGSTPCRWAKSRRSPVAKVPVAVGPRSKALQVLWTVVLLSLSRQCCLGLKKETKHGKERKTQKL